MGVVFLHTIDLILRRVSCDLRSICCYQQADRRRDAFELELALCQSGRGAVDHGLHQVLVALDDCEADQDLGALMAKHDRAEDALEGLL